MQLKNRLEFSLLMDIWLLIHKLYQLINYYNKKNALESLIVYFYIIVVDKRHFVKENEVI